ncbi:hypothetical protein B0H19DRAFT_1073329 [Mycena capillaripes]|nr:hypothetical protein B0H19DRAFT_1073329 [Mycena capillaripes]
MVMPSGNLPSPTWISVDLNLNCERDEQTRHGTVFSSRCLGQNPNPQNTLVPSMEGLKPNPTVAARRVDCGVAGVILHKRQQSKGKELLCREECGTARKATVKLEQEARRGGRMTLANRSRGEEARLEWKWGVKTKEQVIGSRTRPPPLKPPLLPNRARGVMQPTVLNEPWRTLLAALYDLGASTPSVTTSVAHPNQQWTLCEEAEREAHVGLTVPRTACSVAPGPGARRGIRWAMSEKSEEADMA